ncbi:hypothetical protein ASE25_17210 [Terrabacter sp. Root85]|uniref:GNAT family N-acetyltransferase n=1 Tax=Terrabacter sp. Root85 TaxID=1736603 RepID=UPI0006F4200D|nr:GNAT family N-acetyltransferase [Terrabacter sp. Root85]KRC87469.1 hypothetical protein ASE25_17210 [Terrabacter sp. Root85]
MTGTFKVRELRVDDVRAAADLHRDAFPGFFLTSMGSPMLRALYLGYSRDPDCVAICATSASGRLLAVVAGPVEPKGHFLRNLLKDMPRFAWAASYALLRRPSIVGRVARGLFYRGDTPIQSEGALLSTICVSPEAQSAGLGAHMVDEWLTRVAQMGPKSAYLTTDAEDNDRVNRFYQRVGWTLAGSYRTPQDRVMNVYEIAVRRE